MSEENKAIVRRLIEELFNKNNLDMADELIAPDCTVYLAGKAQSMKGPECYKELLIEDRKGFPDIQWQVEDMIAEGDKVVLRWREIGTHEGEYLGISATGKPINITGISIYQVKDGKIVQDRVELDFYGFFVQIGAVSPFEQ